MQIKGWRFFGVLFVFFTMNSVDRNRIDLASFESIRFLENLERDWGFRFGNEDDREDLEHEIVRTIVITIQKPTPFVLLPSQIFTAKFLQAGLGAGLIKAFPNKYIPPFFLGLGLIAHIQEDYKRQNQVVLQTIATGTLTSALLYLYCKPTEKNFTSIVGLCGVGFFVSSYFTAYQKKQFKLLLQQRNEEEQEV